MNSHCQCPKLQRSLIPENLQAVAAKIIEDAAAAFQVALDLSPSAGLCHAFLALMRLLQGRAQEALELAAAESHEVFRSVAFAMIHHSLGRATESDSALQVLSERFGWTAAYQVAEVYAYRSEIDKAFVWLERAYAQRDPGVTFSSSDRFLRPLHADARWQPFQRRLGLA